MTNESEPMMTDAATFPKVTRGRADFTNPLPRICNSPPAMAAPGVTAEICGRPSESFRDDMFNKD
jgi:hypothetical protein